MTDTIQMTDTAQAIQAALRPANYQLGLAKSLLEKHGLSTSTIDTAIMLNEQVENMAIELTNKDYDDYNELVDAAENLEASVIRLEGEVKSLTEQLEVEKDTSIAAQGQKAEAEIQLKLFQAELKSSNGKLKELMALNPERLKSKNSELKKEVESKREIMNEQRLKIRELTRTCNQLKTDNGTTVNKNLELSSQLDEMREMVKRTDGNTIQKPFSGTSDAPSNLEFYIHTLNWGIVSKKTTSNSVILLDDINWHTILRTTYGVDALIRFTQWLSPIIPEEQYYPLSRYISQEIIIALHDYCLETVSDSHPQLVQRVEWAKDVSLLDVTGISDRNLDALFEHGFKCLYDVMKSIDGTIEARCKGIGEKAEREIRLACKKMADQWEYKPEDNELVAELEEVA